MGGKYIEVSGSISQEEQSKSSIVSRSFRVVRVEVLAEEKIQKSISIKISGVDSKGGRQLGFEWEGNGDEVVPLIEKEGRGEVVDFECVEGG